MHECLHLQTLRVGFVDQLVVRTRRYRNRSRRHQAVDFLEPNQTSKPAEREVGVTLGHHQLLLGGGNLGLPPGDVGHRHLAHAHHLLDVGQVLGHVVETRIDWGDGSAFSDWYPNLATVDKAYAAPGYYPLKRQSRCVEHPDVVSDWSVATTISVKDPETVSTPNAPDGPTSSPRAVYVYFTASGAASKSIGSWKRP